MPPRLSVRPILQAGHSRWALSTTRPSSVCLFCSISTRGARLSTQWPRRNPTWTRRSFSSSPGSSISDTPASHVNPREVLQDALVQLQKHAANYVNLSRVQLALRSLRQTPGDEAVRVAVLALASGADAPGRTAKDLARLLLADPLGDEATWERELSSHDVGRPLLIRVGREDQQAEAITVVRDSLLPEMRISSPVLNGNRLELLVMEINPFQESAANEDLSALQETVLVPTVDIVATGTGHLSPITVPVHKALLVGSGIRGAASMLSSPFLQDRSTIAGVVDLPHAVRHEEALPFVPVNLTTAEESLVLYRKGIENAVRASNIWEQGNVGSVVEWLKSGTVATEDGTTKDAVTNLIKSLLANTIAAITEAEARQLSLAVGEHASPAALARLSQAVSEWSQKAHEELQEQLDVAFTGRKWRKLGWWKLFWRVDDVGMLSVDMISQRFLPQTERGLIYLAGQIKEAGLVATGDRPVYDGPIMPPPASDNVAMILAPTQELEGKWPTQIPFTRNYVQETTIPALQALAQRLMMQSLSTSALTTVLGGLVYLSGFGIYETGAVVGLGLVWSLRRLQNKWESAREYWQGEVREEGRKAVRASEASLLRVLDQATQSSPDQMVEMEDLAKARGLVQIAEEALAKLK